MYIFLLWVKLVFKEAEKFKWAKKCFKNSHLHFIWNGFFFKWYRVHTAFTTTTTTTSTTQKEKKKSKWRRHNKETTEINLKIPQNDRSFGCFSFKQMKREKKRPSITSTVTIWIYLFIFVIIIIAGKSKENECEKKEKNRF